jgi:3-deoxy-D-manno-octulosonic-acid transferase
VSWRRIAYTIVLGLLLPQAFARLLWRARRQPAYLKRIPERFGCYRDEPRGPLIWIHAVSVGETRAAEPLVRALERHYPEHRILLTHMTPTGRETGERLFGDRVMRRYLPYDFPGAAGRFVDHHRPVMGLLMETELWPNLIQACRERAIALYLVNARLSEKSHARYRRFSGLAREALQGLTTVAAQSRDDAERFAALGARDVIVTGNLKFDIAPPPEVCKLGLEWRERYGSRPVLLAASTRDGEEALLLERWRRLGVAHALLVIVPRHPQRFGEVAQLLERGGFVWQRRSADAPIAERTEIVLGDSMGEMFAYYSACDVAFVGGSLLPFGGQNLIEPCAVGKPVLFGPHTFNFSEAADQAEAAGAARRVADADELMAQARRLLSDPMNARRMGEAGIAFVNTHRGATERVLDLIRSGTARSRLTPGSR